MLTIRSNDGSRTKPLRLRTSRSVADNRWHHMVAVHAATGVQLYLDGKRVEASRTSPAVTSESQWWASDGSPSDPAAKDRVIVKLSAVDYPLTRAQIRQRYQAGPGEARR